MPRLILLVAVVLAIYIGYQLLKKPSPDNKKKLWQAGAILLVVLSLLLVAMGKLHWIGAAIASLFTGLKIAWPWLAQYVPRILDRKKADTQTPTSDMPTSREHALEILGLEEDASEEDIIQAHRRLIQKCHPDKGGSEYLAAQLNKAKDILIG
jgi:hypothetical protein